MKDCCFICNFLDNNKCTRNAPTHSGFPVIPGNVNNVVCGEFILKQRQWGLCNSCAFISLLDDENICQKNQKYIDDITIPTCKEYAHYENKNKDKK